MDKIKKDKDLRTKLILVGLKELEQHGIKDFSLRRVSIGAEVSCAAPYRHFKNKDDLIVGILEYIKQDWFILCEQIQLVFKDNYKELIKNLCVSNVKFWIANGNFLSVLFLIQSSTDKKIKEVLKDFDTPIFDALNLYAKTSYIDVNKVELLKYSIPALLYGSLMLISKNNLSSEEIVEKLSNSIDNLL